MSYNVWRVEYSTMPDPIIPPGIRYHNPLFIETDTDGAGYIIQVGGPRGIGHAGGMEFEYKATQRLENSNNYHNKHFLGSLRADGLAAIVNSIRLQCPPPPQQRNFNTKTMKTEPCKPDGSFYVEGETVPPYEKCTEWTLNKAMPTLQQSAYFTSVTSQTTQQTVTQQTAKQPQWSWDEEQRRYWYWHWNGTAYEKKWQS